MSPALRNLLIATGVVVSGAALYVVRGNTDPNEVRLLALGDGCVARAAEAEFSITVAGRAYLLDAGINAPRYARLQFPVGLCVGGEADGGNTVILPDLPTQHLRQIRLEDGDVASCASRPGVCTLWGDARPFKVTTHACAWKPDAGAACTQIDGGSVGVENTMQPGRFAGADCRRKSCNEIAGESSAP